MEQSDVIEILEGGGVGVLATDTLYGLVGSALSADTVDRIYALKQRNPGKPLIVLIADIEDVEKFGVILSEELRKKLNSYWPGPYSIILPTIDEEFEYLSRGEDTIAFRIPDNDDLRELLRKTGPLVAPSANTEGRPPATTIESARKYFGDSIDFYIDSGEVNNSPSSIIRIDDEEILVVR